MSETLTSSERFNEMKDTIKKTITTELKALNTEISEEKKKISKNSTTNKILSQLKDKAPNELKKSFHLRTTAIQMKLKELKYDV